MSIKYREMTIHDFQSVLSLWKATEGLAIGKTTNVTNIGRYLERNPGMSFVAIDGPEIVGALLCGHDGLIGSVHHVAVKSSHRKKGIGRKLLAKCLVALAGAGISKCHIIVADSNVEGDAFWHRLGWQTYSNRHLMSRTIPFEASKRHSTKIPTLGKSRLLKKKAA